MENAVEHSSSVANESADSSNKYMQEAYQPEMSASSIPAQPQESAAFKNTADSILPSLSFDDNKSSWIQSRRKTCSRGIYGKGA